MVNGIEPPVVSTQGRLFAFVPTPTGAGYWLVMENGAIFAFGDAQYHGRLVISPQ